MPANRITPWTPPQWSCAAGRRGDPARLALKPRVGEDRGRHAAANPLLPSRETPMPQVALSDAFTGARVMITGGLGFIGSTLASRLVELGADVLLVDNLLAEYGGNLFNVAPIRETVTVEIADIRDVRAMRALLKGCDYLFNLAGQTSHADSMTDPETDLAINCRAQLTLLEACRQVCPEIRVVYASTRQIYGRPRYLPVDEAHPLRPVDVNGVNKMAGEAYHILFHDVYGIRAAALRLTNVYGPRMRIKDARQTFIGVWLRAVLEGRPFEVWNGAQLRDLSYVDDTVQALLLAATTAETAGGVFNVGGDRVVSLKELADMLVAAQGGGRYELREFPAERKRIDIGDYHTDDTLFRRVAGWAPATPLPDGLARSLAYFRAHLAEYI
ncbi:MAG TPA: NAD-dependent epimerase/dehydratase family protein [Stellaceae bacterium]|nr:NAD-dependent epimerase/dehydratase family protein [Stellaceae bacterium]